MWQMGFLLATNVANERMLLDIAGIERFTDLDKLA